MAYFYPYFVASNLVHGFCLRSGQLKANSTNSMPIQETAAPGGSDGIFHANNEWLIFYFFFWATAIIARAWAHKHLNVSACTAFKMIFFAIQLQPDPVRGGQERRTSARLFTSTRQFIAAFPPCSLFNRLPPFFALPFFTLFD